MPDSKALLAEYRQNGSDAAFRELVARFVDLVYSTALRSVEGDTHRAEDVTQTVFADLARQARSLSREVRLGGWLHRHTCFVAANTMRGERRRQSREREAVEMNALRNNPEADFSQAAPMLDAAINELEEADRTAILLRFFEQQDFRSIGQALDSSEDAARMRVTRALEKLHLFLRHRGASLSVAALGTALATDAVTAAPTGLAACIAGPALAGAATGGGLSIASLKLVSTTKLKLGLAAALLVAAVATPLINQHQSLVKVREENQALRQQLGKLAQLESDNQHLSNLVTQANGTKLLQSEQERELLRLRSEVGQLRQAKGRLEAVHRESDQAAAQLHPRWDGISSMAEESKLPVAISLSLG